MTSLGDYTFLRKPMRPGRVNIPNAQNVYKHSTESAASYEWVTEKLDFLLEFMKFIPKFEQIAYKEGQTGEADGTPTGDYAEALIEYGALQNSSQTCFGLQHRMNDASGGGWTFWGAGEGQYDENLDFSPGATEWDHILASVQPTKVSRPKAPDGRIGAADVDGSSYDHIKFCENMRDEYAPGSTGYNYWVRLINNDSNLPQWVWEGINGDEINDKVASNKSYYQVIMDSFIRDKDGNLTDNVYWDGSAYKIRSDTFNSSFTDEDAFYLMASMLESRNRAWDAMTEIFGPLYDTWDSSKMIADYEAWLNDPKRGGSADPHNIKIFSMFLEMQHSIANMLTAFTTGNTAWFTTCKDQVVFPQFFKDLYEKTQSYIDGLYAKSIDTNLSAEERATWASKYNDAVKVRDAWFAPANNDKDGTTFNTDYSLGAGVVPYAAYGSGNPGDTPESCRLYRSWDRTYNAYDNADQPDDPGDPNHTHMHRFMTRWHINGLVTSGALSPSRSDKRYSYDWVVHDVGRSFECWTREIGRVIAINVVNRSASRNYQEKMKKYLEEKDQKKLEEIEDAKMRAKILAERKANENKMAQARKRRNDDFKKMVAYAIKAKISDNLAGKKAKQNKAQPKKKG